MYQRRYVIINSTKLKYLQISSPLNPLMQEMQTRPGRAQPPNRPRAGIKQAHDLPGSRSTQPGHTPRAYHLNIRMVQGLIIETVLDTSLETACVPTGTFFLQKFVPSNAPNYHNV